MLTCFLVFFHVQSDVDAAAFQSQLPTIVALTKGCKSAKVIRALSDIPSGCGSTVLTRTVAVHLLVRVSVHSRFPLYQRSQPTIMQFQGQVDLDAEIAKCDKKLDLARINLDKLRKTEAQADYETTVPELVRVTNAEKVPIP